MSFESYRGLCLQVSCEAVNSAVTPADARAIMSETIARLDRQVGASKGFAGSDVKLIVLPEYFLTGFPMGELADRWHRMICR